MFLKNQMLQGEGRAYIIDKVKKPLQMGLVGCIPRGNRFLARVYLLWNVWLIVRGISRYPEPTRENTLHPNSHRLLDVEDKFFQYFKNNGKKELWKAVWRLVICEYEHDPHYRYLGDFILDEINKSGWLPRSNMVLPYWEEPKRGDVVFPAKALSEIINMKEPSTARIQKLIFSIEDGREFDEL